MKVEPSTEKAQETLALIADGHSIVEGPLWEASSRTLYYCDGFNGGIWALRASGSKELALPKRRCSGLALHERGGFVASGRTVSWKRGTESARLLDLDPAWGMRFFNDLGTSIEGRVYVGSVDYDFSQPDRINNLGYLHVIDLDASSRIVADGIATANGVGVSPDGQELYFNDTAFQKVRRYEVLPNGDLRERDPLIEFSAKGDQPDGLAVAADGSVWVALVESHCIAVVSSDGKERHRLFVPDHHVTSLCFGGDDLKDLFITTHQNTPEGETKGAVFRMRVWTEGMPVPVARVALPQGVEGTSV